MRTGVRILLAASAVFVAACGSGAAGRSESTGAAGRSESTRAAGLYGVVRVHPGVATCRPGTSCSRPARGFRLVFSRNGGGKTAVTDGRGRYRIRLAPGRYLVRAGRTESPPRGLRPSTVRVPRGHFARRDFGYDAGIR